MSLEMLDQWDIKHKDPIVDGKVLNRATGNLEPAGQDGYETVPPSVDIIWHNMNVTSSFKTARKSVPVSVDKVFVEIAKHIRDEAYSMVSVSASAYSFAIICVSYLTIDEFTALSSGMFSDQ